MKKVLIVLVLLSMLTLLYSCSGDSKPSATSGKVAEMSLTSETAAPTVANNPQAVPQAGADQEEVIAYKDRIMIIPTTYASDDNSFPNAANKLFQWLPEDIAKYLMIAPNRITFEVDELRAMAPDQYQEIKDIYSAMEPSVHLVDAYYALSQHADPLDDIFFRTENHWTHLGSYYAAQAFFEMAEIPYHSLDAYERTELGTFRGYLAHVVNDPNFPPDTLDYYLLPGVNREGTFYLKSVETGELLANPIQEVDTTRPGYGIFLGENGYSHIIVSGDEASDRTLLLIGDSFSTAIVTWFADSFHTVLLVDLRYYEGKASGLSALIEEYGVTDTLVLVSGSAGFARTVDDLF